jgi:hypothetical protein
MTVSTSSSKCINQYHHERNLDSTLLYISFPRMNLWISVVRYRIYRYNTASVVFPYSSSFSGPPTKTMTWEFAMLTMASCVHCYMSRSSLNSTRQFSCDWSARKVRGRLRGRNLKYQQRGYWRVSQNVNLQPCTSKRKSQTILSSGLWTRN